MCETAVDVCGCDRLMILVCVSDGAGVCGTEDKEERRKDRCDEDDLGLNKPSVCGKA